MVDRILSNIIIFIFCPYLLASQSPIRADSTGYGLGTQIHLILYHPDQVQGRQLLRESYQLLERLEDILSDYQWDSEVGKINQSKDRTGLRISPTLWEILVKSKEAHDVSQGIFDCTIGAVTHLWRKNARKNQIPSSRQIDRALKSVGMDKFRLDLSDSTLTVLHPKLKFDFGGIGKGYIADSLARFLEYRGVDQYLIDLGGDVLLGSAPPDKSGWDLNLPFETDRTQPFHSIAIAASGSQWQFYRGPDEKYSHIIHPGRGKQKSQDKLTVVLASKAYWADAMATALHISSDLQWAEHQDFGYLQQLPEGILTSKNINDYIHVKFDFDAN